MEKGRGGLQSGIMNDSVFEVLYSVPTYSMGRIGYEYIAPWPKIAVQYQHRTGQRHNSSTSHPSIDLLLSISGQPYRNALQYKT